MNAPEAKVSGRGGWAAGLALASVVLPAAAVFIGNQSPTPTLVALILGIAAAGGAFAFNRALSPAWFRQLSIGLAGLGVVISAYLLLALIGTCGLSVLWGACNP